VFPKFIIVKNKILLLYCIMKIHNRQSKIFGCYIAITAS
jgi:hypothetical protein